MTNVDDEPQKDLRDAGQPERKPLDPPEPLVVPPERLRDHYEDWLRKAEEEEANRVYYHFAERIDLRSYGQMCEFMKRHMAVYREAREMPGFIAGGIRGLWWKKRFYTYTAWDSQAARRRFIAESGHAGLVQRVVGAVGAPGSGYTEWENKVPPEWGEAQEQLRNPRHYYVQPFGR